MKIGILSDSHGGAEMTRQAVTVLLERGAETLVHLGDVETEAVIDELVGHDAHLVFGNCDWDAKALTRYARHVGVIVDDPLGRIAAGGRTVAFTHGHLPGLMQKALDDGVSFLLHGHTHVVRDDRIGGTRVINPGALFRAARYTVAILDPEADRLEVIEVPRRPA